MYGCLDSENVLNVLLVKKALMALLHCPIDAGTLYSRIGEALALFAILSSRSFPGIPMCVGIQWNVR